MQDRSGHLSGQPFDEALTEALLRSAVFCPVITLQVVESLGRVDATSVDWCLVECVIGARALSCSPALTCCAPMHTIVLTGHDAHLRQRWSCTRATR